MTERLLADSDAIARRMTHRLAEDIALPGDYGTLRYLRLVMRACRDGLRALLRQLHEGRGAQPAELAALGVAGARQAEMGVPLEVLLHGYRVAARVVWQEVIDESVRLGELSPPMVVALSERVLEYLDSISGAVGQSYLETRERLVRRRDRERDRVVHRLLAGDVSDDLRRLAAASGLHLAPPYRVLCVATRSADPDRRLLDIWRGHRPILGGDEPGTWIALVDAGCEAARLRDEAVDGLGAAVRIADGSVAASLEEVAVAASRARSALAVGERVDPETAVHHHADTGVYAAVAERPEALDAYVDRCLGPLLEPPRHDLVATLEAVLGTPSLAGAAAVLGVHRHTVVYRLGRTADLLDVDLDEPAVRHRLWLALRLRRLR